MDPEANEIKEEKTGKLTGELPSASDVQMDTTADLELPPGPEDEEVTLEPPPGLLPHQVRLPSDASAGLTTYTQSLAPDLVTRRS